MLQPSGAMMDDDPSCDLLHQADAAYRGVVADPNGYGPVAVGLVARARRAGDSEALVVALRAEAWSERARLSNGRAKVLLDEAARMARRHRLDGRLGEVLITRAAVNHELGRLTAAQRDLDRAADLVGPVRPAELDLQQAALLQNIGRLSDAAAVYRRVLAVPDTPADVAAKVHNNLALIEVQRGRHQAATLAAGVGPALVAIAAQSRGWVMVQAGKLVEGLRQFDRAARLYRDAGLPLGEPYIEYADALVDLRLLPEASEVARRAAEEFEAHGVLLMAAEARLRVARLALLTGDLRGAAAAAERATVSFRRQRRTAWAARAVLIGVEARTRLGEVSPTELGAARRAAAHLQRLGILSSAVDGYLTTGRLAAALGQGTAARGNLLRAHELARRPPVLVRLKGQLAAALAARTGHQDGAVLRHCRAGLADLTRHRAALASMELRALASGHGAELGRLGLEVLLRGGSAPRVLDWMERTRAASLFAVEPPLTEGIEEELAALRVVHAELAEAVRAEGGEPPELLAKQTAIESRVRRATWARQAAVQAAGRPLPAAELSDLLGERVLVEYGVLDGELLAVVVEPKRARLLRLGPLEPAR